MQEYGNFPIKEEIKNPTFNMDQNPFFNNTDSFTNELELETKKSIHSNLDKSREMSEVA